MPSLSHKHDLKKTRVSFIEFDDVQVAKLAKDKAYFGEGNSKGRTLAFDFEYCLTCDLRLLNGQPIITRDVLQDEFEKIVIQAKNGNYVSSKETTVQHTDFEGLDRLIKKAIELGKPRIEPS